MKKIITSITYIFACGLLLLSSACNDYLDIVPKGRVQLETVEDYSNLFNAVSNITYPQGDMELFADDAWGDPFHIDDVVNKGSYNLVNIMYLWIDPSVTPRQQYYKVGSSPTSGSLFYACYSRINRVSNIILQTIDNAKGDEALRERTKAEARILRAYNYFMLINVYAKHYNAATAATDGGVPLSEEFDLTVAPRQASVAEIYAFIEQDIEKALASGALAEPATNTFHPSKAMAYALKAKVHLFKKEFPSAKAAALEAFQLNNYVFDMVSFVQGGMTARIMADNQENLYWATTESNANNKGLGNSRAISPTLAAMFDQTKDTRFSGFIDYNSDATGGATTMSDQAYAPAYNVTKTGVSNYWINTGGIRTTEVILMLAECYAREANYTEMNRYLDMVKSKRIVGYAGSPDNFTPANTTDAVKLVIDERRKELAFGWNRLFDLRRLNTETEFRQTLRRTLPANPNLGPLGLPQQEYVLAPDSPLWVAMFPVEELERNKTLKNNVPY